MSAYVIARLQINDTETYDRYRAQTPAVMARYDGRFIVRGGRFEQLEGDERDLSRVVVIEFPDYRRAQPFYRSQEYQDIIGLRHSAARSEVVLVEGV